MKLLLENLIIKRDGSEMRRSVNIFYRFNKEIAVVSPQSLIEAKKCYFYVVVVPN